MRYKQNNLNYNLRNSEIMCIYIYKEKLKKTADTMQERIKITKIFIVILKINLENTKGK